MRRQACGLIALALSGAASACGVCIEDKVAATYDHGVVSRAQAEHHVVVFAALEGSGTPGTLTSNARRAAAKVRGIDSASIRTAQEPNPVISFAIDPRVQSAGAALQALRMHAKDRTLRITLLRLMP
ncbi:MAG TPA: hypothetical protein VFB54_05415 [Burkholderiales bacterium]|nr:hypothetical protein [Burkholderiales bacterium]